MVPIKPGGPRSLGLVTGRVCALGEALASVGGALSQATRDSGLISEKWRIMIKIHTQARLRPGTVI